MHGVFAFVEIFSHFFVCEVVEIALDFRIGMLRLGPGLMTFVLLFICQI